MESGLSIGIGKFGFSGTFSSNKDFFDSYSYSNKYAFASLECIRNRRIIYINDDISRISSYISPEFLEDINRYSAEQIIEIYGTHVLTHITLGGRYRLMYKSCFTKTTDQTTRKKQLQQDSEPFLVNLELNLTQEEKRLQTKFWQKKMHLRNYMFISSVVREVT